MSTKVHVEPQSVRLWELALSVLRDIGLVITDDLVPVRIL